MTDLRKLAERMALKTRPWQRKDAATKVKVFLVDDFERILREHHEGLAEEIVRVLRGFGYVDHVEDEAAMFDEILLLLEGGGQVDSKSQGTGDNAPEHPSPQPAPDRPPAAPDQPQVTNYDAEAEAQARLGVYEDGDAQHWCSMYNDAQFRIAELKRELAKVKEALSNATVLHHDTKRELDLAIKNSHVIAEQRDNAIRLCDEARAERDLYRKRWNEWLRSDDIARLDNATRHRVIDETKARLARGERPTWHGCLYEVLLDLRDGKLKEASDDDA